LIEIGEVEVAIGEDIGMTLGYCC